MTLPTIDRYDLPDAADLPPPRAAWTPHPERGALLIHDLQRHFLAPFRDGWVQHGMVRNILRLRDACHRAGVPVYFSAQPSTQTPQERGLLGEWWGRGLLGDPYGAQFFADVTPAAGDVVLTKWRYSAFSRTDLASRLQDGGRNELYVCGVYAHIGCLMTAADAFMRDIRPFVVADATADFSRDDHLSALLYISRCCGNVTMTDTLLRAIAGTPTEVRLLEDLANLLEVEASGLHRDDDLRDLGLDSMRLMALLEQHAARHGSQPSFVDLTACATVGELLDLLTEGA